MLNYRRLNLPQIPVKDPQEIVRRTITGGYNLTKPREVLTDEIMDIFHQHNLRPSFVALFGRNDKDGNADTRMIHADLQATNLVTEETMRNPDLLGWKKLLFGINWEILGSVNTFSWWDMSKLQECWPVEPMAVGSVKYAYLNGIHYSKRGNLGIPEGAIKIEEVDISSPTLVRTDIPHMTMFSNPNVNRVGISIRFDERDFNNWNDVVEFFKPLTIE